MGEAPGKTAVDQDPMPQPGASTCCLTLPRSRCHSAPSPSSLTSSATAATSADAVGDASPRAAKPCSYSRTCPGGDTYTRLAAGFEVSVSTAWRYVRETVDLLAARADDVTTVGQKAARLAFAILDGTLVPIDRVHDQRPYYSGKHHRHGVNVQVLADPAGRLIWASSALPGSTHDLTAGRYHDRVGRPRRGHVRRQGLPRRRRDRAHPVQAPPRTTEPVAGAEGGQPRPRPHPRAR